MINEVKKYFSIDRPVLCITFGVALGMWMFIFLYDLYVIYVSVFFNQ
jgi:hypothetical protein